MDVYEEVKKYYSEDVKQTSDLKTGACLTCGSVPKVIRLILRELHDDVIAKYYGCGLTVPSDFSNLKGLRVLDLGCGAGRDVYLLSKLVGPSGFVVGLDMTPEQIATAQQYVSFHTEKFGYSHPNVEFKLGYMEDLASAGFNNGSVDLIVSNCVVNLSPNKLAVLKEAHRALRSGGELYFSDVYADRRIPKGLQEDRVLWGECLSGAMYQRDFEHLARSAGFLAPRVVVSKPIAINNPALETLLGDIRFKSVTYRLVKLDALDHECEDYGQAVMYCGTILEYPTGFLYDDEHYFVKSKVQPVCRNTFRMLRSSRFCDHFKFYPQQDDSESETHFGPFKGCSSKSAESNTAGSSSECSDGSCGSTTGSCC